MKLKMPKIIIYGIDIVKNMLFFASFIVIFLILLGLVLSPSIKKFKQAKMAYYETQTQFDQSENELQKTSTQYQKLYDKNKKIILALKRDFDKNNFKMFSEKYMKVTKIKDQNISTHHNKFIKKTYIVSASLNSPVGFYKFVDASKNYKNILKIYFPVVFRAKDGSIKLLYKLEEFKAK
jgi:lipopolysaccharide export LptBFGC system permease protein LptF